MKSKQFFSMPTNEGIKLINIKNIAAIEAKGINTWVTLNVKDRSGNYISFVATLEIGYLSGTIMAMDNAL